MKKERKPGEMVPKGYRVAYCDYWRNVDICYPIGIHWIVRLYRRIWEWSFRYRPSELEKGIEKLKSKHREQLHDERDRLVEYYTKEIVRLEERFQRQIEKLEEKHKVDMLTMALKVRQELSEEHAEKMGS